VSFISMALKIAAAFEPLSPAEIEAMKVKGMAGSPLLTYPSREA
jgi:hypothetical protein